MPVATVAPVNVNTVLVPEHIDAGPAILPAVGVPAQGDAGVQLKVKPDAGKIAVVNVQVAELTPPAVVRAQLVVVVLLLKSAALAPLKPTCNVVAVALFKIDPKATSITLDVSCSTI